MSDFFSYKNTPIHYTSSGNGAVIVLLHGFLENSSMWKDIIPFMTKKNRVIAIDLLGHGASGNLGYVHSMEDQAHMVKAVLKQLKLRKFTFIGHSMGGYIALAFARLFPDSIKGICLVNSTFQEDSPERKTTRTKAIKIAQSNYENIVRLSFVNLFSEASKITCHKEIELALNEALDIPLQSYIASQEGMKIRKDSTKFFLKATFKKTILLGKKDPVVEYKSILGIAERNKISTTTFSEGHMSHIENKQELINALIAFQKKIN